MSGLAGEVSGGHDAPVILPNRFVQEDSCPLSLSKLCVTDELNTTRLDPVNKDSLANNEGVGVWRTLSPAALLTDGQTQLGFYKEKTVGVKIDESGDKFPSVRM